MQVLLFSKPWGSQSVAEFGQTLARMGCDGADLTVRNDGHVNTHAGDAGTVVAALRLAHKTLADQGLSLGMLTTNILRGDEPLAAPLFETAGELGIKLIKLGYYPYQGFGTLRTCLAEAQRSLDTLEPLARRTGVCGVMHNHFGKTMLTANPASLATLLEGRDPAAIGAYVDTGHIVIEGVRGAWIQNLERVIDRCRIVGIKSYALLQRPPRAGELQCWWEQQATDYDQGTVQWPELLGYLKQGGFAGPVTFHSEYRLQGEAMEAQCKKDLAFFRAAVARAGL